jgi:hypothetical protein
LRIAWLTAISPQQCPFWVTVRRRGLLFGEAFGILR